MSTKTNTAAGQEVERRVVESLEDVKAGRVRFGRPQDILDEILA